MQADLADKGRIFHPLAEHELVLVLDEGVDEISEQPSLDAVVRQLGIVRRAVGHAPPDKTMTVVAAAGFALSGNRLSAWMYSPSVCTDRAPHAAGITRPIAVDVLEVVQALRIETSNGCV